MGTLTEVQTKSTGQGKTDHAICLRIVEDKRYSTPVQMGKKTSLDPIYFKRVLRQLKFTDKEIENLLQ